VRRQNRRGPTAVAGWAFLGAVLTCGNLGKSAWAPRCQSAARPSGRPSRRRRLAGIGVCRVYGARWCQLPSARDVLPHSSPETERRSLRQARRGSYDTAGSLVARHLDCVALPHARDAALPRLRMKRPPQLGPPFAELASPLVRVCVRGCPWPPHGAPAGWERLNET
jgi:hypothetical protein